jgi:ElaB/YqjD/DUF883 family membrane-anchored ribosome-binding protein
MSHDTPAEKVTHLANEAGQALEHAMHSSRLLAREAINGVGHAVHDGTGQLQHEMQHLSHVSSRYIRDEPVKSVLIAAACGAGLVLLLGLLGRSR